MSVKSEIINFLERSDLNNRDKFMIMEKIICEMFQQKYKSFIPYSYNFTIPDFAWDGFFPNGFDEFQGTYAQEVEGYSDD